MDFNGDQENSRSRSGPSSFGAIFMCNRRTKQECFERSLFGLPYSQAHFVNKIKCGTVLFLFEYEERQLYGVFRASSDGAMNIRPNAFKSSGKQFPAQVSFTRQWKCHPVSESEFRDALKDNYYTKEKFGFGLSEDQVRNLLLLFRSRIKENPLPSKSLTTSTEELRKRWKSGPGVSVSGDGRRFVTTDRAEGRDSGTVRKNSARYHTSPSPCRISHRLGSSEKHFSQRDDRDIQRMNAPSNASYVSGDPLYHYGNSSSLGVDKRTTPLHANTSYSKTSPDSRYPDCRSQMVPENHIEPESSTTPDSYYADYRSRLILEPESSMGPTVRFHNPNVIIDNPQDFIPLKSSDVQIPVYDYYGSKNEMNTDKVMPEHPVSRMPAFSNEIFESESMLPSSFGLASGIGASPVRYHDGGTRYWKIDTSTADSLLEINGNPIPQLDHCPLESEKMDLGERLRNVYPSEDIKDYLTRASLRSDTQKPRRSVFSRLAKVKGDNGNNQHSKGNTEIDTAVEQLMGELLYQNRSGKGMRNPGQAIARDGDSRNSKRHIALDDDGYDCSKRKSRGSVDCVNGDRGDSKRDPGEFSVGDGDRVPCKRISRQSSVHDDELDTSKGKSRRATASVDVRDIVIKNPKRLTAPDDDHGRSIARDDDHDTNILPEKAIIEDDNNLASEEGKLRETDKEEAPLVNYKRRSETGKGQHGSGMRGCVKSFDSEIVSINPGKRRKLVRPSFGSSELTCGKSAVAGEERNGGRQAELLQGVGCKRETYSDWELKGSTHEGSEIGLSREAVATDCLLESKFDHDARGNYGCHRERINVTEKEVGDGFVKTASEGDAVNGMIVEGQFGKDVAKDGLLTVQGPSQDTVVRCRGRNESVKGSSHEDLIVVSLKTESTESLKVRSLESSDVKQEGLAQMLGARDCSLNMEGGTKDAALSAVGLKELVEETSITVMQEHGPECGRTMLNCSVTFNAVEDFKDEQKPPIHVASDQMPKVQCSFQDGVVSTEGLKQTADEVSSKATPELTDGSFENRGKGNEVDLAIERNTGEKALSEGLSVYLQQATKRGLSVAVEEFCGGYIESNHKGKKVKLCLESTCETLEQSQEPNLLQQLAEEPPFCTDADKVKSEKDDGVIDDSVTADGRETFQGFESSKPESSGAKTEGQVSHHSIALPVLKHETTAKTVGEDFECEREDKLIVTTQSELQQKPLRRIKKILKRVKKGTSKPSA